MKPIELEMSAFGSFGGCEVICFEQVRQGIFLVTGDTGAGKTTIFDAITYALYGKTSGGRREGNMMRSHFAKEGQTTYVRYTFQNKGSVYTVYRQPEQTRISKRKGKDGRYGMTKEGAKVRLTLPDGTDYTGKGKETDAKLCEIIGLDAEQFTQIAMIAQGDFLKLLLASSRERREIFARIFDTHVCEQVQSVLEQRYKKLYGQLEDNRKLSEHDVQSVRLPQQSVYAQQWEEQGRLSENDNMQLMELLDAIQKEVEQKEQAAQEMRDAVNATLQSLRRQIEEDERRHRLLEEYAQAKEHFEQCEHQLPRCEKLQQQIERGKRAAAILHLEEEMTEKCQKLNEMQEKMHFMEKESERIREETPGLQEKKNQAQAKWEMQGNRCLEQAACLEQTLPDYEKCEQKETLCKQKEGELRTVLAKEKEAKDRHRQFMEQSENVQRGMEERSGAQKEYYTWKEKESECSAQLGMMRTVLERKPSYERLVENVQKKCSTYLEMDEAYSIAAADYENKNRMFLDAQAGIMAQRLEEGKPCPVCGSTHHPQPMHIPKDVVKQADVDAAVQVREQADKARQEASTAAAEAGNRLKQEEALIWADMVRMGYAAPDGSEWNKTEGTAGVSVGVPWEDLENRRTECGKTLEYVSSQVQSGQKRMEEYETYQEKYRELQAAVGQAADMCAQAAEGKMKLQIEVERLQGEVRLMRNNLVYASAAEAGREIEKFRSDAQELRSAFDEAAETLEKHVGQLESLKGQQIAGKQQLSDLMEENRRIEHMFYSKLEEQAFASVDEYHEALKEVLPMAKREEQLQKLQFDYIEAKTRLEFLTKQTENMEPEQPDIQEMRKRQNQLEQQAKAQEQALRELYSIRSGNEKCIRNIRNAWKERMELEKRYGVISSLYKTANGRLTGAYARLNFQTYMQRIYFKKVVNEANKRLRVMSRQQFELRCRDMESLGRQGETGLDLDVCSLVTGQIRDVKTLSGGESFMAALAMALGMADIIQNAAGSVRLETMFIDEGFGTLDDDSRREAIRILDDLAGGKQLIGIISHVTELKEQIPVRLHVEKNEKGSHARWL